MASMSSSLGKISTIPFLPKREERKRIKLDSIEENLGYIVQQSILSSGGVRGELVCPHPEILDRTRQLIVPTAEVRFIPSTQKGTIIIKEDLRPSAQSSSSITSSVRAHASEWSAEELRLFNHNFTFGLFSTSMDKPLRNYFPHVVDDCDSLTPDLIMKSPEGIIVFEFATLASGFKEDNLRAAHMTKSFKYKGALERRVQAIHQEDRDCRYFVYVTIIVSDSKILSGIDLPTYMVDELCARYCFSRGVMSTLYQQGFPIGDTERENDKEGILGVFDSIKYEPEEEGQLRAMSNSVIDTSSDDPATCLEYATVAYKISLMNAIPKAVDSDRSFRERDQENILEYKRKSEGTRLDTKAVIQIPGFLPRLSQGREPPPDNSVDSCMFRVWNCALHKSIIGGSNVEMTEQEALLIAEMSDDNPFIEKMKEKRRNYRRIFLDNLDNGDVIELASVGINGKRYSSASEVKAYREEKKEAFSWEVDTKDIEAFLGREENNMPVAVPFVQELTHEAIIQSLQNYENPTYDTMNNLSTFLSSSFYQYCDMVTDIGIEISASLKQNCKREEFILKKLKHRDIWLLIKPTNSSSHIFVSFMWLNEGTVEVFPQSVFKKVERGELYSCTEFTSFNASKLVNVVKCGPFSISMFAQWLRYYELKDDKWPALRDFWYMMKLMLLVHLEDKSVTESTLSMFRYISMEKFVERNMHRTKTLEKFPDFFRSRLALWVAKRLLSEMEAPEYTYSSEKMKESSVGHWQNMRNPYTENTEVDPGKIVELYYLGYAKNKEEVPSSNVDFQLVRKVVKYEDLLKYSDPEFFGKSSPVLEVSKEMASTIKYLTEGVHYKVVECPDYEMGAQNHEWARLSSCAAADAYMAMMRRTYGEDWQSVLDARIRDRIYHISWENIATLKASSTFDPEKGKEWKGGKVKTERTKAIIAILEKGNYLERRPYYALASILDQVDKSGGFSIDLFRKMQHMALREIYVLGINDRIVQLFVEEIARAMASFIDMELMMHPRNKVRLPQEHMRVVDESRSAFKRNVCSSNDAAVWNQLHHVNKFAQFMCRILPKHYWGFIVKALKQWKKKRIALPDGVLNLLKSKPTTKFHNPIDGKIAKAYSGEEEQPWLEASSQHLLIESGMMQGILHYLSSVYHASTLMVRDNMFKGFMMYKGISVHTTDMVSSDDSGRLTDILADNEEELARGIGWARVDQLAIIDLYKHFGISLSVSKSTLLTQLVFEINSEFFSKASLNRPTIKWVLALLAILEIESIYGRQESFYSLKTSLLEGGSGFYQASMSQYAQAILHYKLMGSSVSTLWPRFIRTLAETQDPSLGYFLMDHPRASGMFGFNFNFYCACKANNHLSSRLAYQLNRETFTTTETGSLVRGVQIRYGNRKKAYKLIEAAEKKMPNWKEEIEKYPHILYQSPENVSELICRILVKLTGPNVTTSLSKSNSVSRMISSAVYVVGLHATTIGTAWMDMQMDILRDKDPVRRLRRFSLWQLARQLTEGPTLNKNQIDLLFPLNSQYEATVDLLSAIGKLKFSKGCSRRKLRTKISVFPEATTLPHSLEQMVRWKWFGAPTIGSGRMLSEVWDHYRARLPWLADDPKETLEKSPYESQMELRNIIARDAPRYRTVYLTGTPVTGAGSRDLISSALLRNQFPGYSLIATDEIFVFKTGESIRQALHTVSAICTFPLTEIETRTHLEQSLCMIPQIWMGDPNSPSPRVMRLACIQFFFKLRRIMNIDHLSKEKAESARKEVYEISHSHIPEVAKRVPLMTEFTLDMMLQNTRLGIRGGFTRPQRYEDGQWVGEGEWIGLVGTTVTHIQIKDREVERITVSDLESLMQDRKLLNQLMLELDVKLKDRPIMLRFLAYDGKSANPEGRGSPLFVSDLNNPFDIDIRDMWVTVREGNLRLMCDMPSFSDPGWRQRAPRPATIASFRSGQSDFDWNAHYYSPKSQTLLILWSKNESMKANVMQEFLKRIPHDQKYFKKKGLDMERFTDFCKVGVQMRLRSVGWLPRHLSDIPRPLEDLVDAEEAEDWDVDYEIDEEALLALEEEVPPEDDCVIDYLEEEYEGLGSLQDFEYKLIETKQTLGDIRKTHRFFMDFVDSLNKIGVRERELILSKVRPSANTPEIEDIVMFYERIVGWEFTDQPVLSRQSIDKDFYGYYLED